VFVAGRCVMEDLDFAVDFDHGTGARAYSFYGSSEPYLVGLGLRTIASSDRVLDMLEQAARTGMCSYGDEIFFLDEGQQRSIADPQLRRDLVSSVADEHGFSRYLLQATASPLDEVRWQKLTTFYPVHQVFRAFEAVAREQDAVMGVAYPIKPSSVFSNKLERGTRFGTVEHEPLDRFLDAVITWTTHDLERDPHRAAPPISGGPSYVFEREVASRVFGSS
jgi:hypothetical protein